MIEPEAQPTNAADAKGISEVKKRERSESKKAIDEVRSVLSTETGQNVLRRILEDCGLFENSVSGDPATLAFREGRRYVGLRLMAMMSKAAPDTVAKIIVRSSGRIS